MPPAHRGDHLPSPPAVTGLARDTHETGTLKSPGATVSDMAAVTERFDVDPERAWAGAVVATVTALVGGSILFPETVYDGFIWRYFWGPVFADAHGAECAARAGGTSVPLYGADTCAAASGPVAYPGYTLVSEAGYAITLIVAVIGGSFMFQRLNISRYRALYFGAFPFMFFGGALRVVEDVNDAIAGTPDAVRPISYPLNTLIISPLIYFTVFFIVLAALLGGLWLERRGEIVEGFEYPLGGLGVLVAVLTVGGLVVLSTTSTVVSFHPAILAVVLVGATVVTAVTWVGIERFAPQLNEGTGLMGLPLLWGQSVDGVANVVGLDWAAELGLNADLVPKHPVNDAVVNITNSVLPAGVIQFTGDTWPFLLLKIGISLLIIWVIDQRTMDESPRFSVGLLLVAVAVGLGPGTRDMLRATFGV